MLQIVMDRGVFSDYEIEKPIKDTAMPTPKGSIQREKLHRGLKERNIQLIALGGAIGVGLFLGSGVAIRTAGPALLLSYLFGGLIIYCVMRALGEIAADYPLAGSFSAYAGKLIGPRAGFVTGWTYWFLWVITGMAEITAVGVYCAFWWPELPQWIPALAALACMTAVNLTAVKLFGAIESWFALIKIVTIVVMIAAGLGIILFGLGRGGEPAGIANLYALEGGFMPHGFSGVMLAMTMVMFSFLGVEMIGVTAGEAANPSQAIPSAIGKVLWRILVFYVGALFVIMCIYPWNEIGDKGSPFVLTFRQLGIDKAAAIINFVVLTAALSSCNSGLFSTGRMLYTLSLQGQAPKRLGVTNARKVPAAAVICSSLCMLIGVLLNYLLPEKVFLMLASIATFPALWIWGTIVVLQICFRRSRTPQQIAALKYPMLFYPYANWFALAGLIFVAAMLYVREETRIAMITGPAWILLLMLTYKFTTGRK